ncbi:hypothetical protein [Kocuria varians]|nr:hypothetical protein [Kocuria varians]
MQLRTELQHAWATAVETMDLFSGSRLKYDDADDALVKFFAIASSLMADHENTAPIPGVDGSKYDMRCELESLNSQTRALARLNEYSQLVKSHSKDPNTKAVILKLDMETQNLETTPYSSMRSAEKNLAELEADASDSIDVVLVQVQKIHQLRRAYPNYFADTEQFSKFIASQLDFVNSGRR